MGRIIASLFIALFFLADPICFAQSRVAIYYPEVEQKDRVVHITYLINDSELSDKFLVSLLVFDQSGDRLNAQSISGDVGYNVSGGGPKHIAWNAEADSVIFDVSIDVKILVEALSPTKRELVTLEEARRDQEIAEEMAREDFISLDAPDATGGQVAKPRRVTRTGLVFQSLAFPGWGLSRVKKKPHWLKGLAAYGCVAGSVVLNRKALETYGQIEGVEDYESKDQLYQEAMKQDNISEVLAYGAIGIWVADFIWTLVGTKDFKPIDVSSYIPGLSVKTHLDPKTYAPMLGISYRF